MLYYGIKTFYPHSTQKVEVYFVEWVEFPHLTFLQILIKINKYSLKINNYLLIFVKFCAEALQYMGKTFSECVEKSIIPFPFRAHWTGSLQLGRQGKRLLLFPQHSVFANGQTGQD